MNEEEEKVIGQLKELAEPRLVGMTSVIGAHHQEREALLDNEPTHGYHHLIEDMGAHEVGPHHLIDAAPALPWAEILVQHLTNEDGLHQEDFRLEEMKGSDHRPLPITGAQNRLTVTVDHETYPVLTTAHDGLAIRLLAARPFDPLDEMALQS